MHSRVQFNLKSPFWTVRATAILPTQGRFGELPLLAVSSLAAPSLWANCLAGRLSCGSFGSNESFGPSPKDFQRVYTRYIHETDTCCFHQSCCLVSVGFHPYRNRSQGRRPSTSMPYSKLYFCDAHYCNPTTWMLVRHFAFFMQRSRLQVLHLFWNSLSNSVRVAQRHCIDVPLQSWGLCDESVGWRSWAMCQLKMLSVDLASGATCCQSIHEKWQQRQQRQWQWSMQPDCNAMHLSEWNSVCLGSIWNGIEDFFVARLRFEIGATRQSGVFQLLHGLQIPGFVSWFQHLPMLSRIETISPWGLGKVMKTRRDGPFAPGKLHNMTKATDLTRVDLSVICRWQNPPGDCVEFAPQEEKTESKSDALIGKAKSSMFEVWITARLLMKDSRSSAASKSLPFGHVPLRLRFVSLARSTTTSSTSGCQVAFGGEWNIISRSSLQTLQNKILYMNLYDEKMIHQNVIILWVSLIGFMSFAHVCGLKHQGEFPSELLI